MPDSNFNMVNSVDSLSNLDSVAPAKDRQQQKKKQKAFDNEETQYQEQNDFDADFEDSKPNDDNEQHSIDYRA